MSIPWRLNDYWISVGKCRKEKIMKFLCEESTAKVNVAENP
jgi:hypothetical protein